MPLREVEATNSAKEAAAPQRYISRSSALEEILSTGTSTAHPDTLVESLHLAQADMQANTKHWKILILSVCLSLYFSLYLLVCVHMCIYWILLPAINSRLVYMV